MWSLSLSCQVEWKAKSYFFSQFHNCIINTFTCIPLGWSFCKSFHYSCQNALLPAVVFIKCMLKSQWTLYSLESQPELVQMRLRLCAEAACRCTTWGLSMSLINKPVRACGVIEHRRGERRRLDLPWCQTHGEKCMSESKQELWRVCLFLWES